MHPMMKFLRGAVPFAVSGLLLAWVMRDYDLPGLLSLLTPGVAAVFGPALLLFLGISLLIEAICLVDVIAHTRPFRDLALAARIKAASYPLGILNYALGVGAVVLLLRRRVGMRLADATGAVLLIGLFDLASLIALIALAGAWMGAETPGLRAGIILLAGGGIVAGIALLRAPISLGPLDRLRDLQVLRTARDLPLPLLARLGILRLLFACNFVALAWATLMAFGISSIPLLSLIVNVCIMLLVAALPIAAAGLGTGQIVFVSLFSPWGDPEVLLAASLTLSFGLIVTRAGMGILFAGEYAAEALSAPAEDEAQSEEPDRGRGEAEDVGVKGTP
jgi:hypothetical protein